MPLVRVEVRNEYGLGAPEIYREANKDQPKEILEGVAVAGLVGVLRQLGDLAEFAAEVLHGLQEELAVTSSRSRKLMGRVRRVEVAISPLEKVLLAQRSQLHFAYVPGSHWHAHIGFERNKFEHADVPQFILDSYEDCSEPPRLHLLDRFDPGGPGSCLKRYSDPSFFKKASAGKCLEDKKRSRVKKLRSCPRNGGITLRAPFSNPRSSVLLQSPTMSGYDATLRSDLRDQTNLDLRNGSSYIIGDFRRSYSAQPTEKESREFISSPMRRHSCDFLECNSSANLEDESNDVQINRTQGPSGQSSCYARWDENITKFEPAMQDDHHTHLESVSTRLDLEAPVDNAANFETVDKMGVQTSSSSSQDLPKPEYVDINLDELESEKDIFMDAPNAIEPEYEIEINCTGMHEVDQVSRLEDEAAELGKRNLECQTSYSESNGLANTSRIIGGCEHIPVSVSSKSSFAAPCCMSCISAKDGCDSVLPVDKSLVSLQSAREPLNPLVSRAIGFYGNGSLTAEFASCRVSPNIGDKMSSALPIVGDTRSPESQKPAPEMCAATPVSFWTNGSLLGLQPSKPPSSSLLNDLSQDNHGKLDKTMSFKSNEGGLRSNSSAYQEYGQSSSSFGKIRCKISPADLDIKLGRTGDSLHQTNASFGKASLAHAGSGLPVTAKMHQDSRSLSPIFEMGNRLHNANVSEYQTCSDRTKDLLEREPPTASPSSSPPLRHMKISFQPIDGFEASKLKLKFPCGISNDESCTDIFPSFQLVPEVSIARQNGGSDSDDDTFYRSSPSLLDGCDGRQSESNSEQWESGESPTNKDPDLCHYLSRISCAESVPTAMENGRSGHGNKIYHSELEFPSAEKYMQSSDPCRADTHTNSKNPVELEFAATPDPSHIPPVQWLGIKTKLDYAFNLNDSLTTISQQPKPAPFNRNNIATEQKRKNTNAQREANKGKSIDEKEDFLQLIRSKSFNLRPTLTTRTTTVPSVSPAHVNVTAILKKANSIRQAVGSDDAEDDGNWSDA